MTVSFLPFPTKLVAEAIDSSSAERTAVIFYGATLLVIFILVTSIMRYAGSKPELIEEEGRDEVVALASGASRSRPLCRRLGTGIPRAQGRRLRLPRDRGVRDPARPLTRSASSSPLSPGSRSP
jgi:hypothetical protein